MFVNGSDSNLPVSRDVAEILQCQTETPPSWDDLLGLISKVKEQYLAKGEKSKIRQSFRNGETTAAVLEGLVDLIPDEYGLGILRVGLSKLITVRGSSNPSNLSLLSPSPVQNP